MTLARAFHYAGIPSVVASLLRIPDNSTATIMELFYQELHKGLDKDMGNSLNRLRYIE